MTKQSELPKHKAEKKGERIAKVIARAGICSRRDAEKLIEEGKVSVNGKLLTTPAFFVEASDRILVNKKPLPQQMDTRLWCYHKPSGLLTSHRDPQGRKTVFDNLPTGLPRVVSVGRLDINSEGLLLLTTDGALSRRLELPSTAWTRRYRVRAHGKIEQAELDKLARGIEVDGIKYGAIEATLERVQGHNVWILVAIKEGKNREVRKVFEHLDLKVNRLIRISYGPFQLGDLKAGEVKEVPPRILRDQLGMGDRKTDKPAPHPKAKKPSRGTHARRRR
jgi:23S rRNA pseudouridine2605 synthase